jgi:hypothetical protein
VHARADRDPRNSLAVAGLLEQLAGGGDRVRGVVRAGEAGDEEGDDRR